MKNPYEQFLEPAPEENPYKQFLEPESNYLADKARRVARSAVESSGDALSGIAYAPQAINRLVDAGQEKLARAMGLPESTIAKLRERQAQQQEAEAPLRAVQGAGQEVRKLGEFYDVDPAREAEFGSKVAQGLGSLPPVLATAPLGAAPAALVAGGMAGEAARAEAQAAGASPTQQAATFALNAPVAAATEPLLGAPAMLKSILDPKTVQPLLRVGQELIKGAVREGIQEGLEQTAQNVVAKDVVGYAPDRSRLEGVAESAAVGALVGGGTSATFSAAAEIDRRKREGGKESGGDTQTQPPVSPSLPPSVSPSSAGPSVVGDLLAEEAKKADERRATIAAEEKAREDRKAQLAERAGRFDQQIEQAAQVMEKPDATFAEVQGALQAVRYYAEDNSLGLALPQVQLAERAVRALEKRAEDLRPAEEARRDAEAAAVASLEKEARERRKAEAEKLKQVEKTGRDPQTGTLLDLQALPDEELQALDLADERNKFLEDGTEVTEALVQAELERRGREQERAAAQAPTASQYTWEEYLRAHPLPRNDDVLQGELDSLAEEMTQAQKMKYFRTAKTDLDRAAMAARGDFGFEEVQTPSDLIEHTRRMLRGEKLVGRGTGPQVEFATGAEQPAKNEIYWETDREVLQNIGHLKPNEVPTTGGAWVMTGPDAPDENGFVLSDDPDASQNKLIDGAVEMLSEVLEEDPTDTRRRVRMRPIAAPQAEPPARTEESLGAELIRRVRKNSRTLTPGDVQELLMAFAGNPDMEGTLRRMRWDEALHPLLRQYWHASAARRQAPARQEIPYEAQQEEDAAAQAVEDALREMGIDEDTLRASVRMLETGQETPEEFAKGSESRLFRPALRYVNAVRVRRSYMNPGAPAPAAPAGIPTDLPRPSDVIRERRNYGRTTIENGAPVEPTAPRVDLTQPTPSLVERMREQTGGVSEIAARNYLRSYIALDAVSARAYRNQFLDPSMRAALEGYWDRANLNRTPTGWSSVGTSTPGGTPPPPPAAPAPDEQLPLYERLGRTMERLAKFKDVWKFGKDTPTAKTLGEVAEAYSTPSNKLVVRPTGVPNEWRIATTAADGTVKGTLYVDVNDKGIVHVGAGGANSDRAPDNGGKNAYQAINTWAHNNGWKVRGDSLTPKNQLRRSVNMLSSALRHGTTRHLIPYSTQQIEGWQDEQPGANNKQRFHRNVGAMLAAISRLAAQRAPVLNSLTYDLATDTVVQTNEGKIRRVSDAQLDAILEAAKTGKDAGIGPATARAILLARAEMAAAARGARLAPAKAVASAARGSLKQLLYARGRSGADAGAQGRPAGHLLTEAEIEQEAAAIRQAFPRLLAKNDVELGNLQAALKRRGYRGQVPPKVQAAVLRLKGERTLIVLSDRAYRDRAKGAGLLTHEMAHPYWDMLPANTQQALRELHAQEVQEKTGPLYRDGQLQSELDFIEDLDERGHKEWFAERIARLNEQWAKGKLDTAEQSLLRRLAYQLREFIRKVWSQLARRDGIDPESKLFVRDFRRFFESGGDLTLARQAGADFAQKLDLATGAEPPAGNPNADAGNPDYIPTVEAMRYATAALGKDKLRQLVRERHPRYAQADPGTQINLVEPIAREAVAAAQMGQDPEQAIRAETQRLIAQARATAQRAGRPSVYGQVPAFDGPYVNARGHSEIVTRNTVPGEKPWRVTRFDEQRRVIAHDDYATREAARASAEQFGQLRPEVEFATGAEPGPVARLESKLVDVRPGDRVAQARAESWLKVMPAFQGGKYQMAEAAAKIIREQFTQAELDQIDTVNDYFGGGGMWGAYLALSHFKNAKRVVVHEYDELRAAKIELFHTRGDQIEAILEKPEVQELIAQAVEMANSDATTSGTALAARIEMTVEGASADVRAIAGALIDAAMGARGRAVDATGKKTAEATAEKIIGIVIRDGADARAGIKELEARGTIVELRQGNSYAAQPEGAERTVAVMDPPYYRTTGYDSKQVGLSIYSRTAEMIRRMAAAGNAVVYTDSAWHIDNPAAVPTDEPGQRLLGNIVDSLGAFGIVKPQGANRNELIGINRPGQSAPAAAIQAIDPVGDQEGGGLRPDAGNRPDAGRDLFDGVPAAGEVAPRAPAPRREDSGGDAPVPAGAPSRPLTPAQQRYETLREDFDRATAEADRIRAEIRALEQGDATPAETRARRDELRDAEASAARLYRELDALRAEVEPPTKPTLPAGQTAEQVIARLTSGNRTDRKTRLLTEWRYGKEMRDKGRKARNELAEEEGQRIVDRTKRALDDEFPGWEAEAYATDDKGRRIMPPAPAAEPGAADESDAEASPFAEPPAEMPVRAGKLAEVYGQSGVQPTWLERTWDRVADTLRGIKGAVPEIPAFPAASWNKADRFIREQGAAFYDGVLAFHRRISSANDAVQRTAEEQVAAIAKPLIEAGGTFDANAYARLQSLQIKARKLRAEGQPVPENMRITIEALNSQLEDSPYVLFSKTVLLMDLHWRATNLKDSAGNPIKLPMGLNLAEIEGELARLDGRIGASEHAAMIGTAIRAHKELVAQVAADLKARGLLEIEALQNPFYFPHVTLEKRVGEKVEQRELRVERVKPEVGEDFRGYLVQPVGSTKAIESDYVRAMYWHLVQVGAHNTKADAIQEHLKPYDMKREVEARAKELARARGRSVSWEQAFHEEYEPRGYVLMGTGDNPNPFSQVTVDRDKLAQRLGIMLSSGDLQEQLRELGKKDVHLLPEDFREVINYGTSEVWVVPARVAEALRGIAQRSTTRQNAVLNTVLTGWWKKWKLFTPQNHIRYEVNNVTADLEKIFSAAPGTLRYLYQAAQETRGYFLGEPPSADLRAAVKEGVINTITAQELGGLQQLPNFRDFETTGQRLQEEAKAILSAPVFNLTRLFGGTGVLGRVNSVEQSAWREATFRYAKYLADVNAIRNGARPEYAGAYWRDIEAMGDSRPGAGDAAARKAGAISKATFGDYGDLSPLGQTLRDKWVPFYSWIEVNFKYHANLLRNLRDMVRANELSQAEAAAAGARAAAVLAAGFGTRAMAGVVLRLALPYAAVALWNAGDDRDEIEAELSEEDRRRFHVILGRDAEGKPQVVYGATALMDVLRWFNGPKFVQAMSGWMHGKKDFSQAMGEWAEQYAPDLLNTMAGNASPWVRGGYTVLAGKQSFPDVFDQRTIPAYDMRRVILGQMTDDFTADRIEKLINKDYYGSRDLGTWAKQLILQVRTRDPEAWAFYAIRDKAERFYEQQTGITRESSVQSPDQQLLRNFRRAIYQGDPEKAVQFYHGLLEKGYTAERFGASIRAQDPLSGLPKENGLRRKFVESLTADDREMLQRAERYYSKMAASRGRERVLFPSERSGVRGQQLYQANPRDEQLRTMMQRVEDRTDDEELRAADRALRQSLQRR